MNKFKNIKYFVANKIISFWNSNGVFELFQTGRINDFKSFTPTKAKPSCLSARLPRRTGGTKLLKKPIKRFIRFSKPSSIFCGRSVSLWWSDIHLPIGRTCRYLTLSNGRAMHAASKFQRVDGLLHLLAVQSWWRVQSLTLRGQLWLCRNHVLPMCFHSSTRHSVLVLLLAGEVGSVLSSSDSTRGKCDWELTTWKILLQKLLMIIHSSSYVDFYLLVVVVWDACMHSTLTCYSHKNLVGLGWAHCGPRHIN